MLGVGARDLRWNRESVRAMKTRLSPMAFAIAYALTVPLVLGVVALWEPLHAYMLTSDAQVWAAWVQAIGSIGAIAAGFGVAIYQSNVARSREETAQRERIRSARRMTLLLASLAITRIRTVLESATSGREVSYGDAKMWKRAISNDLRALEGFNVVDADDPLVILHHLSFCGLLGTAGDTVDDAVEMLLAQHEPWTDICRAVADNLTRYSDTAGEIHEALQARLKTFGITSWQAPP